MGLVDELRGSRICIDTSLFIYFIEKDPKSEYNKTALY